MSRFRAAHWNCFRGQQNTGAVPRSLASGPGVLGQVDSSPKCESNKGGSWVCRL